MTSPFIAGLGAQELVLILLVVLLLFGATKLPELARGSGRALRIFKAETSGLLDDDDDTPATKTPEASSIEQLNAVEKSQTPQTTEQLEIEKLRAQLAAERLKHDDTTS